LVQIVPTHIKKISSGVPGFNFLVGGGIPAGASVLLQAPPGTEKDLFGYQFIKEGLVNGDATIMVLSMSSTEEFSKALSNLGIDTKEYVSNKMLRILDWYSWKTERIVGIKQFEMGLKTSRDLTNVSIALTKLISDLENTPVKRAVVTLLSAAMNIFPQDVVFEFAQKLRAKFQKTNITSIFFIDKEAHPPEVISTFQQIFDGVIDIEVTRENDNLVRKIGVLAMTGTAVEQKYKYLKVGKFKLEVIDEESTQKNELSESGKEGEGTSEDSRIFSVALSLVPSITHSQQPSQSERPSHTPIVFERTKTEKDAKPQISERKDVTKTVEESLTNEVLKGEKIIKKEESEPEKKRKPASEIKHESKEESKPEITHEIIIDEKKAEKEKEKSKSMEKSSFVTELIKNSEETKEEKIFTIEDTHCIYDDKARSILESERLDEIKKEREIQKYGSTEVSQSVEKVVEAHNQAIAAITAAKWEITNAKKANLDTKQAEEKLEKAQKALDERDYEHAKMFAMDAEIIIRDLKSKVASKEQQKQTKAIITGRVAPTCPTCGKIVNKSWKMCFFCKSKL